MSFLDDIRGFNLKVEGAASDAFPNIATAVLESIRDGSPVTGSPGQPVDTGNLRASWQLTFPSANTAIVSTNCEYAESNEDGVARPGGGPFVQKSAVGGRHSVQKTVDNFPRLVESVVKGRAP